METVNDNAHDPFPPDGSLLSFPERGPWGRAGYRGNCSGYVYQGGTQNSEKIVR
jgi:hypothetical protein